MKIKWKNRHSYEVTLMKVEEDTFEAVVNESINGRNVVEYSSSESDGGTRVTIDFTGGPCFYIGLDLSKFNKNINKKVVSLDFDRGYKKAIIKTVDNG